MSSVSVPGSLAPSGRTSLRPGVVHVIGLWTIAAVQLMGSLSIFASKVLRGSLIPVRPRVLFPCLYQVGVLSVPVVVVTGTFIGMVLAVQSYDQFAQIHMENRLGGVINASLVKELGPVLAAVMLAGRVGSSIAAEIGTMRVTEQIDALQALGANPVRYLVVPRFLACLLLIPLLTALADGCGILGGWWITTTFYDVNSWEYWDFSDRFVTAYDVFTGLLKSLFFGAAIALIACHRGFHSRAGAEGVGRAATEAFVLSFIAILVLDFVLGVLLNITYTLIWPHAVISF